MLTAWNHDTCTVQISGKVRRVTIIFWLLPYRFYGGNLLLRQGHFSTSPKTTPPPPSSYVIVHPELLLL
ncbi:hypothetical protein [Nitrososphaera viennensis]|uniref:hypothetical protein n=1 Tax=Nitrososphaera viennensis TaxID=1034015 RepID=UPI001D1066E1|nr:hypothetical protein [Nitrososphaera viennensis]